MNDHEGETNPEEARRAEGFATRAVHRGLRYAGETGAVTPPIYLTSTFERGNPDGFDYTRSGNPNFRNLSETLASLEGARYATVFGSGVAAITAIISSLSSGDVVLAEENLYGCTYRLFERVFAKFGVEARYADFTDAAVLGRIDVERPALVWIESPTNPMLKVLDIAAIAAACASAGAPLVVDNTFASSFLQRPVELGATLSLLSTTKYTSGHSDVLGGAVCTNSDVWQERMIFAQKALGLQPSPMDSWLVSRGIKTEALRMARHCENGLALASWLESVPGVRSVRYPFLPSHPQYDLARKQMAGGSGMVTADLGLSESGVGKFLGALRYFVTAESLGGVESLVCHPATMTHAAIPAEVREQLGITQGVIRFSAGIEDAEDLIADVAQALGVARLP